MTEAAILVVSWLSSQRTIGELENSGLFWTVLAIVAVGAVLWVLVWIRMRPLFLPRSRPAHHFRRARQKELRPR
jgi:hypothetical protein